MLVSSQDELISVLSRGTVAEQSTKLSFWSYIENLHSHLNCNLNGTPLRSTGRLLIRFHCLTGEDRKVALLSLRADSLKEKCSKELILYFHVLALVSLPSREKNLRWMLFIQRHWPCLSSSEKVGKKHHESSHITCTLYFKSSEGIRYIVSNILKLSLAFTVALKSLVHSRYLHYRETTEPMNAKPNVIQDLWRREDF